jgi:rod shape determining protein RodA
MTPLLRKFLGMNWLFFLPMVAMMAFGILSIYSAVHFRANSLSHVWNDQLTKMLYGMLIFFVVALVDYKWVKWGALPLYTIGLGLMVVLLVKGNEVFGQKISLTIGGLTFQPSQVAISSTVLLIAYVLAEGQNVLPFLKFHFLRLLAAGLIFAIPFLLILKAKDIGSALVMLPIFGAMLLAGNIPYRYLISILLVGLMAAPLVYFFGLKDYQRDRIDVTYKVLMGQPVNEKDEAYALINILTATATAGWEGKGNDPERVPEGNKSLTHLNLVPANTSHNDFIFTVIAEAFGFSGSALMMVGFLFILVMALVIAFFAGDSLGRLIVTGIVALLFAHVFEHIGMNIGILPITGIPLPLVSYGGTFVMIVLGLFGMMQSVWVHRNKMLEVPDAQKAPRPLSRPSPMAYAN